MVENDNWVVEVDEGGVHYRCWMQIGCSRYVTSVGTCAREHT